MGLNMRKSGLAVDTGDLGIDTGKTHGTRLAMDSWFLHTLRAKGDIGVDAFHT